MTNDTPESDAWARQRMSEIGPGVPGGDPEAWHSMADDFLLECLGAPLSPPVVEEIRQWFDRGVKWYA